LTNVPTSYEKSHPLPTSLGRAGKTIGPEDFRRPGVHAGRGNAMGPRMASDTLSPSLLSEKRGAADSAYLGKQHSEAGGFFFYQKRQTSILDVTKNLENCWQLNMASFQLPVHNVLYFFVFFF
jgi:hypothetical protein